MIGVLVMAIGAALGVRLPWTIFRPGGFDLAICEAGWNRILQYDWRFAKCDG